MRNPIFNLQGNTDADLKALEPVPERYAGQNNPYRGVEQHGVESPHDPRDAPGYGDTYPVEVAPEHPRQDPVPVIVVNESAREQKDWSVQKWSVNAAIKVDPIQIAGYDTQRQSLRIRNDGPDTVYLNKDAPSANPAFGWELAAGESIDIDAHTPVWMNVDTSDGNDSASVYTLATYSETLPNR